MNLLLKYHLDELTEKLYAEQNERRGMRSLWIYQLLGFRNHFEYWLDLARLLPLTALQELLLHVPARAGYRVRMPSLRRPH